MQIIEFQKYFCCCCRTCPVWKPTRASEVSEICAEDFKRAKETCSNIHDRNALQPQLCTSSERTEDKHISAFQLAICLCMRLSMLICQTTAFKDQTSSTHKGRLNVQMSLKLMRYNVHVDQTAINAILFIFLNESWNKSQSKFPQKS